MRFLDPKGRLFGIINLLDLLVVMVVFIFLFAAVKNSFHGPKADRPVKSEFYIKVFARVPNEVANNPKILKPGDKVLAGSAIIDKVLQVRQTANDPGYSDITMLLSADCVNLNNEYYCANAPIKINSFITLAHPDYYFNNAVIVDVEKKNR